MDLIIFVVGFMLIAILSQALTLRSIRKNEDVDIPFTFTKSIWKHWEGYLELDAKRKYQFQYAGWAVLFIVIAVLVLWTTGV